MNKLIGAGLRMQEIDQLIAMVSATATTVLILGETGTGKELVARAIHEASAQKGKHMVTVNCGALPATTIESELFGHERGSFTGAIERRIGKFESANNSTLFLDEIGELPLELQARLLRAIQEREIERLGGNTVVRVNVRIIAASNRDLWEEVKGGRFRSDLYYRLNVFPIVVPPLRERKEDLPALTSHFVAKFAANTGKEIAGVSDRVMQEIMAYSWPGNVRELEHLIERSVVLTNGSKIEHIYLPAPPDEQPGQGAKNSTSIKDIEREYIIGILERSRGKIHGPGGAAELLRIPPTTLHSKMKRLGIIKKHTWPPSPRPSH